MYLFLKFKYTNSVSRLWWTNSKWFRWPGRVTCGAVSPSHGSTVLHMNASNGHRTLLMLTCRSQLEVKPLSRLALTAYSPQQASSSQDAAPRNFQHGFPLPAREKEMVVMHMHFQSWNERKQNSLFSKERVYSILAGSLFNDAEKLAIKICFA